MRFSVILLSLSLLTPAYSQQAQEGESVQASAPIPSTEPPSVIVPVFPPLTVKAPRPNEKQIRELKKARVGGGVVAGAGAGLALNAGIIGLGGFLVVWGGGLVFVGGLIAYLAHRRLQGKEDFGPANEDEALSQPRIDGVRSEPSTSVAAARSPGP
jgi:hypothetical protein